MIHQHIESERQLTIHVCFGTILKQELIDAIKTLYDSGPTPNHLWDLTETDLSQIKGDDVKEIAEFAARYAPIQMNGRTAFVSTSSLGFGLARMYEAYAENAGQSAEINVFRSPEEAEEWISTAEKHPRSGPC
jgi:hypothetical protein